MSSKIAEAGKCTRCHYQPATHSHECRSCHYITMSMVTIHGIYSESELEGLADDLKKQSLKEFIDGALSTGAFLRRKVGITVSRLAYPANVPQDEFRRRVVAAIHEYLNEINGVREYEAKPGNNGKYMNHWISTVAGWIGKANHKHSNPNQ